MEPTTRNDTQTTACRRQSSMRKTLSLALASSFMRGRCAKPSSTARAVPATRARPHRQTELACSSGAVHTSRQWTGRDQHGRHGSGSQTPKTGKNKSSRSTVNAERGGRRRWPLRSGRAGASLCPARFGPSSPLFVAVLGPSDNWALYSTQDSPLGTPHFLALPLPPGAQCELRWCMLHACSGSHRPCTSQSYPLPQR